LLMLRSPIWSPGLRQVTFCSSVRWIMRVMNLAAAQTTDLRTELSGLLGESLSAVGVFGICSYAVNVMRR
jgi:hypothetical protein